MLQSNQPYHRVSHDSVWAGTAVGALSGGTALGATQYFMKGHAMRSAMNKPPSRVITVDPSGDAIMTSAQSRYNRMFGGKWGGFKKTAAYLGAGLLGAGIGALADYMTD
jgi:predicted aminopeptidase